MRKRPIIGISGSIVLENEGAFIGYRKSYASEDYINSVTLNGGLPLILPIVDEEEIIEEYINQIDGLLLTGGHDVDPYLYQEQPKDKIGKTFHQRDRFDYLLIKYALLKQIPIFGICRGFQLLNVYFGGSLYQDLSYNPDVYIKHDQIDGPEIVSHGINLVKNTKIRDIFNCDKMRVNSFHHQILKDIAPGFIVSAYSDDGVVEAFEKEDYFFLIGVQWHPEMLHKSVKEMNKLFKAFVTASK